MVFISFILKDQTSHASGIDFDNTAIWERRYPWAYKSTLKGGWICKVCEEYSKSGDEYWKTKA